MEKKNAKAAPAAGKQDKQTPPMPPVKPFRKKLRRLLRWFGLFLLVGSIAATIGAYYRWIPVKPEWMAKVNPYLEMVDPYLAKINLQRKPLEETASVEKPMTNFPLVDLDGEKKKPEPSTPAAPPSAETSGKPAVASAASLQPAKTPVKESPEAQKTYGKLAKLYNAMKPEEAAAVFNNLDDDQVILILFRMEEEAAAKVLASLEAKKAARLTQAMIKRK